MKLVVFGATGGTGREVVARALAEGHEVVAVARKPESVTVTHVRLRVVKGDVLDAASVAAAVVGAEAVLSSIGPPDNKKPGTLISQGIANIVAGCETAGVRRLVYESGIMMSDGTGLSLFGRMGIAIFRSLYRALYDDKVIAEATVVASSLDWVIIRPPTLVDGPARGGYTTGVDPRVSPAKKLPHADVAEFMVKAAADPALGRTIQTIGF